MEKYDHEQIHYQTDTGMRFDIVNTSDTFVAMHWHNSLEIIMVLSGYIDVNISGTTDHIEKGGFCVINSKTIHSTVCKRQCRYLILQIPYDLLSSNIPGIETVTLNCVCPSLSQRRGCYEQVADLLEKLAELYETPKDNEYRLVFHVLVFELLYQLFKNFKVAIDPVLKKQSANNVRRVGVVLQYVRQHYNENISLEDAARLMALNREYFARFFKKYMGMTFMEYVFSVRLEHAYADVIGTDTPIAEIVENNGFGKNYRLFLRKFRQQYGCSPGEKRKQQQAG